MRVALVTVPAALALSAVVAGCGGSDMAAATRLASAPAHAARSKHATISTRKAKLGTFLVDGRGRTLYLFRKDKTRHSTCTGTCAEAWPPVTTREKPEAEGAVKASRLSTSRRPHGSKQVVYNGHPLYRYAFDSKAGQTKGQGVDGFGARWWVVAPSGKAITAKSSAPASPPSPYGY
jgi:predicted lipoprotein with Yx(FWY)xxD motif